ncbi:MAG: hypothetical protein GX681_00555 [Clostridiaceae bacterium]|jgi:hypothetical protein|nr:hypothetical protein [Clostridiaceae bacterium]
MSILEITQIVRILLLALLILGLALFVFTRIRRRMEYAAKQDIIKNDSTLIGLRAITVTELRPGTIGEIRTAFSPEKENEIALSSDEKKSSFKTFPAISSQYISKGRSVRVTGGNKELYRVRSASDSLTSEKK